jgi:hypothetical protein
MKGGCAMGSYIKKSFKVGPFRFNLSKSGIGTSFGVKGARIGVRPNGRAYSHVGRFGLYHRQELGKVKPGADDGTANSEGNSICLTCKFVADPIRVVRGSFFLELALWLFFLIPGLLYSIWRLTTKSEVCPACGNPSMIPISSPAGQELLAEETRPTKKETELIVNPAPKSRDEREIREIGDLATDYINKVKLKKP